MDPNDNTFLLNERNDAQEVLAEMFPVCAACSGKGTMHDLGRCQWCNGTGVMDRAEAALYRDATGIIDDMPIGVAK